MELPKQDSSKPVDSETKPSEIKDIMDALGRGRQEGNVKDTHLGKILLYLQQHNTERLRETMSKLALICGMNIRYVRENYLDGLFCFGVLKQIEKHNDIYWEWIGIKALTEKHENNGEK